MLKNSQNLKQEVKIRLIRHLPANISKTNQTDVLQLIRKTTESIVKNRLNSEEKEKLVKDLISEILGFGPIDSLLRDPSITEIMINGPKQIYIEQNGKLLHINIQFRDNEHLFSFIDKVLSDAGRRATELEPYVDARLTDGSRVNIVKPPISLSPLITLRKFNFHTLTIDELLGLGTLNKEIADFLDTCIKAKKNIIISGGTGAGKTTLLNSLTSFIPKEERIIVIENTRELHINHPHVISLECRPSSITGKGEITLHQLAKNSLHMRPDRIILGEIRGEEALDVIQAMNTGQEGSLCTIHSNSCLDCMERLQILTLMANSNISSEVAIRQVVLAVDLIIQMSRLKDGSRKIIQISEVIKNKKTTFSLKDIFVWRR